MVVQLRSLGCEDEKKSFLALFSFEHINLSSGTG
jgi:hypothetical protein